MLCMSWWALEAMVLMAGVLPRPSLNVAVMGICLNVSSAVFCISRGMSGLFLPLLPMTCPRSLPFLTATCTSTLLPAQDPISLMHVSSHESFKCSRTEYCHSSNMEANPHLGCIYELSHWLVWVFNDALKISFDHAIFAGAASTRVSNSLGAGYPKMARRAGRPSFYPHLRLILVQRRLHQYPVRPIVP